MPQQNSSRSVQRYPQGGQSGAAQRSAPQAQPPRRVRQQRPVARLAPRQVSPAPIRMFYKKPGPVSGGFVATLLVLQLFGLIVLFSASYAWAFFKFGDSYHYIRSQAFYAVAGLGVLWVASRVDYRWIKRFAWPLYLVTLGLLVVVLFMDPINNARRWINIKNFPTIQVSEIAKFSIVLLLAMLFEKNRNRIKTLRYGVFMPGLLLVPILVLLYLEPHNSAMIIMACIVAAVMFVGGTRLVWFFVGMGAAGGFFAALLMLRPGYVQERFASWFDPFSDMLDSTRQTAQSLFTIGSGGLFGVGIGNSTQKHLWLPEAQNDFVFAILCEELGFVGAVICIVLFALLVVQGVIIAARAPDRFGCLLVVGSIAQVGFQFFFNVAVVTNTIPNTGISLPFFSSGGTSLLLLLGQMGILLSVSRAGNQHQAELQAQKAARLQAEQPAPQETQPGAYPGY